MERGSGGHASFGDLVVEKFGGVSNQKDECQWTLEGVSLTELGDELLHAETIVLFDLIQELHGMELWSQGVHKVCVNESNKREWLKNE